MTCCFSQSAKTARQATVNVMVMGCPEPVLLIVTSVMCPSDVHDAA